MAVRNMFFDLGILPSYEPKVNTIAIGNLSVGGTGKTPFTELLIRMLQSKFNIAIVSRGYGRKTKGFLWVKENSSPDDTGDESLQIKQKFPGIKVAVCEKRVVAIKTIEQEHPEVDLILLDDAFQHRYVTAKTYVLLTKFRKPYLNDHVLPMGTLRESRKGAKRADFIVVTKCPLDMSQFDRNAFQKKLRPKAYQSVFFSHDKYGKPYDLFTGEGSTLQGEAALIVSGIADNTALLNYVSTTFETAEAFKLSDHVDYNKSLVNRIKDRYTELASQWSTQIITTEKDAVKLREFESELKDLSILVLPYEHELLDMDIFADKLEHIIKR